jgi:hyperosmotically inducible periplasmic protein
LSVPKEAVAIAGDMELAETGKDLPCRINTGERAMNVKRAIRLAGGTLILVASFNAWSQSSEPAATSTESSASAGTPSKSSIRKANRALSKKVLNALSKGGVDTSGINVLVKGGAVTLAGTVPEAPQSEKAGSIAKGMSGVTSVKNALTIHEKGR